MQLIHREFEVDVPVERAWHHLSRVAAWPSWARHIRAIEIDTGDQLCLGSNGCIRLRNGLTSTFKVIEFEPFVNWEWVGPFLWLTVRYDHQFVPLGDQRTKLVWVVEADGRAVSLFGRLFAAIYRRSMERAIPRLVDGMARGDSDA